MAGLVPDAAARDSRADFAPSRCRGDPPPMTRRVGGRYDASTGHRGRPALVDGAWRRRGPHTPAAARLTSDGAQAPRARRGLSGASGRPGRWRARASPTLVAAMIAPAVRLGPDHPQKRAATMAAAAGDAPPATAAFVVLGRTGWRCPTPRCSPPPAGMPGRDAPTPGGGPRAPAGRPGPPERLDDESGRQGRPSCMGFAPCAGHGGSRGPRDGRRWTARLCSRSWDEPSPLPSRGCWSENRHTQQQASLSEALVPTARGG
jgi:hypothetical protein